MNIKEYLKKNRITVKQISRDTGIPYATLNDIFNGRTNIDRASVMVLKRIADELRLSMESVYDMCREAQTIPQIDGGRIYIANNKYYLEYNGCRYMLCKNNKINSIYITDIAGTVIRNAEEKRRMEQWH